MSTPNPWPKTDRFRVNERINVLKKRRRAVSLRLLEDPENPSLILQEQRLGEIISSEKSRRNASRRTSDDPRTRREVWDVFYVDCPDDFFADVCDA